MNRQPTYDILGQIAIIKFDKNHSSKFKKSWANDFLNKNSSIKTILEKSGKIQGRLRKAKTKFIAGEKNFETVYIENGCRFKFNVDETYFSPRLSNERKLIAEDLTKKVNKNKNKILVMFAGVAPYPIVIGKFIKQASKKAIVVSNEINRKACKYAGENVIQNKLQDYVKVIQCDAKKLQEKLKQAGLPGKFDFIMMARPNLKETFLPSALKLSNKGTIINYHGFGTEEKVLAEIKKDAVGKIGKITMRKAGEIAPFKYRWNCSFKVN